MVQLSVNRLGRAAAVAVAALCMSCLARSIQHRIEVKGEASIEEKTAFVRSLITQARWDRLKVELQARFPDLTQPQLDEYIGVRWDVLTLKSFVGRGTSTTVFVSVIGRFGGGFDPEPVVAAAVKILEAEVNPAPQVKEPS